MDTSLQVAEWRRLLPDDWDKAAIERVVADAYSAHDRGILNVIAAYLGYFEALSVGALGGIYDIEILHGISSSRIQNIADSYQTFFKLRRNEANAPDAYINLVAFAKLLKDYGGGVAPE